MKSVFKPTVTGFVVFCLSMALVAKNPTADSRLATPLVTNDLITLQTNQEIDVQSFELIITGPNHYVTRQVVNGNHVPFVEIYDAEGNVLADGQYSYELRAIPRLSEEGKAAMRAMRESGDYSTLNDLVADGVLPERIFAQGGSFRVYNGYIVVPETEKPALTIAKATAEGRPDNAKPGVATDGPETGGVSDNGQFDTDVTRDQVILDDLIVEGSICAGLDCVNGESFGFDTLRLKENNLRIKFQDTSNSASFPSNDWQITANDSSNGGANKFSIDDIDGGRTPFTIEASAPSHSLYVDDGGRIGVGTSTPVVEMHVVNGDTPTLRLEQDGSSGFTAQTWDLASNETNFFIRDASNGSRLPFRIQPSAPSNSLYIASDGDIGFGDASPDADLDLENGWMLINDTTLRTAGIGLTEATLKATYTGTASDSHIVFRTEANGQVNWLMEDTADGTIWKMIMNGGGGVQANTTLAISLDGSGGNEFIIEGDGDTVTRGDARAVSFIPTSDRNMKENFGTVDPTEVLSKVLSMPITSWNYKTDKNQLLHIGPMAQDFHAAFGTGDDTGINVVDSAGVAFGAIQGLHKQLEAKDAKIDDLEAKLAAQSDKLADQDAKLAAQEARLKALEELLLNK